MSRPLLYDIELSFVCWVVICYYSFHLQLRKSPSAAIRKKFPSRWIECNWPDGQLHSPRQCCSVFFGYPRRILREWVNIWPLEDSTNNKLNEYYGDYALSISMTKKSLSGIKNARRRGNHSFIITLRGLDWICQLEAAFLRNWLQTQFCDNFEWVLNRNPCEFLTVDAIWIHIIT